MSLVENSIDLRAVKTPLLSESMLFVKRLLAGVNSLIYQ